MALTITSVGSLSTSNSRRNISVHNRMSSVNTEPDQGGNSDVQQDVYWSFEHEAHDNKRRHGLRDLTEQSTNLNIAEEAINELVMILARVAELAEPCCNEVVPDRLRSVLNTEANTLRQEYSKKIKSSKFDNKQVLAIVSRTNFDSSSERSRNLPVSLPTYVPEFSSISLSTSGEATQSVAAVSRQMSSLLGLAKELDTARVRMQRECLAINPLAPQVNSSADNERVGDKEELEPILRCVQSLHSDEETAMEAQANITSNATRALL